MRTTLKQEGVKYTQVSLVEGANREIFSMVTTSSPELFREATEAEIAEVAEQLRLEEEQGRLE